ncbi:unnamed protein product [Adineta steineri]|uniref:Uncharacterized protein n=1 Tax=Adineta steineri TaxID=433720 RepID=A0A814G1Y2_9BILA|nr:unnamed protein product [Adineta steineri]CAF4000757.1 unnamed protein product [Adineta steineri]
MDDDINNESDRSDSSCSPVPFGSSILAYIPRRYDRSLVAPTILSERNNVHAPVIKLPPLKLSSSLTTTEEEDFIALNLPTSEQEYLIFKQKFNRLRATLSKSYQFNVYTYEKVRQKKADLRHAVDEQRQLINHLLASSSKLNLTIRELRNQITEQCHKRDVHELRQLKLQSTFNQLNKTKDQSTEILKSADKESLIEHYNSQLLQLKNQSQEELADRDDQIEKLKKDISEKFGHEANEHKKLVRSTEQAFKIENQNCAKLQEFIDDYEANVYRAKKSCCLSTSYRLYKLATQLRLYSIIELTLNELFHSSCSCGQFQRCHETFMRLHNK